jgi:hypothetical protein
VHATRLELERRKLRDMIALGCAETEVADAWRRQLLRVQAAVAAEVQTAYDAIIAARRDGRAETILACRRRFDRVRAELITISDAVEAELRQIRAAEIQGHITRLDQMQRVWSALSAT